MNCSLFGDRLPPLLHWLHGAEAGTGDHPAEALPRLVAADQLVKQGGRSEHNNMADSTAKLIQFDASPLNCSLFKPVRSFNSTATFLASSEKVKLKR